MLSGTGPDAKMATGVLPLLSYSPRNIYASIIQAGQKQRNEADRGGRQVTNGGGSEVKGQEKVCPLELDVTALSAGASLLPEYV